MTPWDDVALAKLSRVLGPAAGQEMMAKVLAKMHMQSLRSADDLYRFGALLGNEAGFAAPVGGLLIIHATIHGGNPAAKHAS
jgi:hypothetical protein